MSRPDEMPLVSIVTPSYNQGEYIEETIRSVLSQDYPRIEHIVVDGGSTDNTLEILRKYEGRLQWTSGKDNGQTDALNKGFKKAKGTVLAWLNSDDIYYPGAISRAMAAFRANPGAGIVYGMGNYIDTKGRKIGEYPTMPFDYDELAESNFICQPSAFFTAAALRAAGELDEGLDYVMDYDLWIRMARNSRAVYIPELLAALRIHPASKTTAQAVATYEEILKTAKRYFGRAGGALVYGYAYNRVKHGQKAPLNKSVMAVKVLSLFLKEYARLNRTLPLRELKRLDWQRIKAMISAL